MRSPLYEQLLDKEGVQWEYLEAIELAQINDARSLRTQARLDTPIDRELVESYAQMYRQGSDAPAIVVWKPGDKYVVIDGNQRRKAKEEARHKRIDAYLVKSNDQLVIDRLTWTWNNKVNGKRLSKEECLQHAITFVKKYGYTQKQAAEEWSIPPAWVRDALGVEEVRESLGRQKVKVPDVVPDSVLHDLRPLIRTGEDVLAEASKVVFESALPRKETVELVDRVLRGKTHDEKLEAVKEFAASDLARRRRAESKGGRVRVKNPRPRDRLLSLLDQLTKLVGDYPDLKPLLPGGDEYKSARTDAKVVVGALVKGFGLGAVPREAAS